MTTYNKVLQGLLGHVREEASAASGLLVPISGGSDGALAFYLCATVFPKKTIGVHYGANLRSRAWFEAQGRVEMLPLPTLAIDPEALRWALVQDQCYREGHWAVSSRNRSEQVLGTYSRPSEIATFQPLVGLWKSEVMSLCREIAVPPEILTSSRKADPACGRPVELSDIGIEKIDRFLKVKSGEAVTSVLDDFGKEERRYLERLYRAKAFKTSMPVRGPLFARLQ